LLKTFRSHHYISSSGSSQVTGEPARALFFGHNLGVKRQLS
jgi:hypothetical protein